MHAGRQLVVVAGNINKLQTWAEGEIKQHMDLCGEGETKYMTFEPDGGGWNNIV